MWPFTKGSPAERPLKNRIAGAVLRDRGLREALGNLAGFPKSLEFREIHEGYVIVPWRLGDWSHTLHCWCPVRGRDDAITAQRTRELLTDAGARLSPVIHQEFSEEAAERRGVWFLLEHEVTGGRLPQGAPEPHTVASLGALLVRLHERTSSVPGQPWRREANSQSWSAWQRARVETLLRTLESGNPDRAGGVAWLRERFAERHQPDEVFVPFNLTLGPRGWAGIAVTGEGDVFLCHPEAAEFAPFERDLAEATLWLPDSEGEAFIERHLASRGPRERQRVHLNLGPMRAFAALERAGEPGGWERLLRIAEQDL